MPVVLGPLGVELQALDEWITRAFKVERGLPDFARGALLGDQTAGELEGTVQLGIENTTSNFE